jgi:hypothetical protein
MVQTGLLSFVGTAAATALQICLLLLQLSRSSRAQYNEGYEYKFRALKYGRTAIYALLSACQVCAVI